MDKIHRELARWRKDNRHLLPQPSQGQHNWGGVEWYHQCGGKIAHLSMDTALRQFLALLEKPGVHCSKGGLLTIYRCPWCDWLHMGHSHYDTMGMNTLYCEINYDTTQVLQRLDLREGSLS